ncbi:MAG: hypothetical protein LQ346_007204 [Caloplaca aetnensis]|nr:MAG: hypothetical protein LQ346_007204 [Caloplaca aetnensis]
MFLPAESTSGGIPSISGQKDTANPYLCGFLHSRPGGYSGGHHVGRPGDQNNVSRSHEKIRVDFYHHPAQRDNQGLGYLQAFDLYSLGNGSLDHASSPALAPSPASKGRWLEAEVHFDAFHCDPGWLKTRQLKGYMRTTLHELNPFSLSLLDQFTI